MLLPSIFHMHYVWSFKAYALGGILRTICLYEEGSLQIQIPLLLVLTSTILSTNYVLQARIQN